jgi:hypothetical protein
MTQVSTDIFKRINLIIIYTATSDKRIPERSIATCHLEEHG